MKLIAKIAMEQQLHTLIVSLAKKLWKLLRLVLVAVRKSVLKSSRPFLKRVKLAAISSNNSIFGTRGGRSYPFSGPRLAYEFSCSNSPACRPNTKWPRHFLGRGHSSKVAPPSQKEFEAILGKLLMGGGTNQIMVEQSPALPGFGFGRSPAVRQLRITDSPFPVNYVADENNHIDEDAEKFIAKFYQELFHQRVSSASPMVVF